MRPFLAATHTKLFLVEMHNHLERVVQGRTFTLGVVRGTALRWELIS